LSDNTRSRLGRRHPFMYASAVPVAACYALLWNPPQLSSSGLFFYLLIMAVLIRTLITLFETPSSSLLPELTSDYDERTSLQSFRHFFGWTGGSLLAVIAFGFLLVPTESQPVGTLNQEGYRTYGWLSAWIMFFAIMISSLGTQRHIRYFGEETSKQKASITRAFTDIKETLVNPNFFALFLSTIAGSVASGLTAALTFLMLTYFWDFSSMQIFYWTGLVVISALLGFVIAPKAAKTLGKKKAVMVLGVLAFSIQPLPVLLRLLNVLPENGTPLLFPLVATINTLDLGLIIAMQIRHHVEPRRRVGTHPMVAMGSDAVGSGLLPIEQDRARVESVELGSALGLLPAFRASGDRHLWNQENATRDTARFHPSNSAPVG
ncbi:MAG: hypothetical protein EBY62_06135, partial [Cellvibrionales bacterium]|nr:hypothetical protein [Cellvibrionales bacterium]